MPIFDRSYQHWGGQFKPLRFRWTPMVRYHLRDHFRRKMIWLLLFLSFVPAIVLSIAIYFKSQVDQEAPSARTTLARAFAGDVMSDILEETNVDWQTGEMSKKEEYREITRVGFLAFLISFQSFFVLVISSAVGSGLIARDVRSNALEVYLTKPITAVDYVLGKLSVIGIFVFLVTFFPSFLLFVVAASLWPGYFGAAWFYVAILFLACFIAAAVNGIVILGLSSLAKSSRYATIVWFALCFLSSVASTILLVATGEAMFYLISYRASYVAVFDAMFGGGMMGLFVRGEGEIPLAYPVIILIFYFLGSALLLRRTIRALERR